VYHWRVFRFTIRLFENDHKTLPLGEAKKEEN
jgi:hypothetical protein